MIWEMFISIYASVLEFCSVSTI